MNAKGQPVVLQKLFVWKMISACSAAGPGQFGRQDVALLGLLMGGELFKPWFSIKNCSTKNFCWLACRCLFANATLTLVNQNRPSVAQSRNTWDSRQLVFSKVTVRYGHKNGLLLSKPGKFLFQNSWKKLLQLFRFLFLLLLGHLISARSLRSESYRLACCWHHSEKSRNNKLGLANSSFVQAFLAGL